jgi:hydrogenase nickel incorporation protein HypA/HybF
MHELSVTQSVLEIALRHARQGNARHITDLYLVIGELASIVDDSVQFYWDMISQDTIAEGARLHFKRLPAEMQCMICAERFHPGRENFACPVCGSNGAKIVAGEEFYMESIGIDNDEPPIQGGKE